jgi:adenylate cyclase
MEYTVIGNTVNLAARLNALAGRGEVVVSRVIKEHFDRTEKAGREFQFAAIGPQVIKGITDPVEVFKIGNIHGKSQAHIL